MDKTFQDFKTHLSETQSKELSELVQNIVTEQISKAGNQDNKISDENLVIALSSALVKFNIESTIRILETYHNWKEIQ